MEFNPNELILDKVRSVEEYDIATDELVGMTKLAEEPKLSTSADDTEITDAYGSTIADLYRAQKGEFTYTNSLHSLDLAASQYGTKKEVATSSNKIIVPVSETIQIGSNGEVKLKYVPVGTSGAEVKEVKIVNDNNTYGKTYTVSASPAEDKFTINAVSKKITLPSDVTGRVFVHYERESEQAIKITKRTDSEPEVRKLIIHALFRDPCNKNIVYAGVIVCPRAQIDPTNVELNLTSDGKHAVAYKLQKPFCDEDGKLFDIIVTAD